MSAAVLNTASAPPSTLSDLSEKDLDAVREVMSGVEELKKDLASQMNKITQEVARVQEEISNFRNEALEEVSDSLETLKHEVTTPGFVDGVVAGRPKPYRFLK